MHAHTLPCRVQLEPGMGLSSFDYFRLRYYLNTLYIKLFFSTLHLLLSKIEDPGAALRPIFDLIFKNFPRL